MLPEPLCISGTRSANDTHAKKKKKRRKAGVGRGGRLDIICMRQCMHTRSVAGILPESRSHPRLWEDSRPQRPDCTLPAVTRRSSAASIQGQPAGRAHSGVIIVESRLRESRE